MTRQMSDAHLELQDEDNLKRERNNIVELKIVGGNGDGPAINWLMGLDEGSAFLVREKHLGKNMPRYMLVQYFLLKKFSEKAVLLVNQTNAESRGFVDPRFFTNEYDLHEMLYDPKTMPPIEFEGEASGEKEQENGNEPKVTVEDIKS